MFNDEKVYGTEKVNMKCNQRAPQNAKNNHNHIKKDYLDFIKVMALSNKPASFSGLDSGLSS